MRKRSKKVRKMKLLNAEFANNKKFVSNQQTNERTKEWTKERRKKSQVYCFFFCFFCQRLFLRENACRAKLRSTLL